MTTKNLPAVRDRTALVPITPAAVTSTNSDTRRPWRLQATLLASVLTASSFGVFTLLSGWAAQGYTLLAVAAALLVAFGYTLAGQTRP